MDDEKINLPGNVIDTGSVSLDRNAGLCFSPPEFALVPKEPETIDICPITIRVRCIILTSITKHPMPLDRFKA